MRARRVEVPTIVRPLLALFRHVVRGYFRRHFHGVRVSRAERFQDAAGPLLVYANHSSWWDPMVAFLLGGELMPARGHYAPMDAGALERYAILKRLGVFPVEMKTARGGLQFLRTGELVLRGGGVLWVTPQGRFVDGRERPLEFRPGLAALLARVGSCTVLPLAIEYPFWDERLPECLLHFGEPVQLEGENAEVMEARLVAGLERAMEELKGMALTRDAGVFPITLARGRVGTGGIYGLGQRMWAGLRGACVSRGTYGSGRGEERRVRGRIAGMMLNVVALAAVLCALGPAVLFVINMRLYRQPGPSSGMVLPGVSVLIPARDEEGSIAAAVESVLGSVGVAVEVVVMDDGSTDGTAAIVRRMRETDARVRLEAAPLLPAGWNGKQHACWALARAASNEVLCFVDADVQLHPEAVARMAAFLERSGAALVSGFPRQETETWMEWMLLPLIHFVLLGFLPMSKMRSGTEASFAAGCGQFLMVRRDAYFAAGGHARIRETMHDGLRLPRLLRQSGYRTDLADLTEFARCRMYRNAGEVWRGLAKNATEGIAAPVRIFPISVLLLLGQVAPFLLAVWLLFFHRAVNAEVAVYVGVGMAAAWVPRVLASWRYQQSWRSAALHPVGIVFLLAVQWYAWGRERVGGSVRWKDRAYAGGDPLPPGAV